MNILETVTRLRACTKADDAFLYDVFCTTWAHEVAALPNQNLAQHVLRIQHIAQERRFANRYPAHQRYVVLEDGEPAGRLYVSEDGSILDVIDLTLMPGFRGRGVGTELLRDIFEHATREDEMIRLRIERRNQRGADFYSSLGFRMVSADDVDNHFEWVSPAESAVQHTEQVFAQQDRHVDALRF